MNPPEEGSALLMCMYYKIVHECAWFTCPTEAGLVCPCLTACPQLPLGKVSPP
jgi:hypothetical protein